MCLMWWRCFRQLTKARQTTFLLYGLLQGLCSKPNSAQPMLPWLSYFAFLWKLKYLVQCPLDFFLEPRHYAKRRFLPPLPITIFVATAKRSLSVSLHGVSKQAQCTSGHSHFFESHRSCNALGKCPWRSTGLITIGKLILHLPRLGCYLRPKGSTSSVCQYPPKPPFEHLPLKTCTPATRISLNSLAPASLHA